LDIILNDLDDDGTRLNETDRKRIITGLTKLPPEAGIHVIQRSLVHLHQYAIGIIMSPTMVGLGMREFKYEDRMIEPAGLSIFDKFEGGQLDLSRIDNSAYNRGFIRVAFEVLASQKIVQIDDDKITLTPYGKVFIRRAGSYGVTDSYTLIDLYLEEVLTGNPDPLKISKEGHMGPDGRIKDTWGAGLSHEAYMGRYNVEDDGQITFNREGILSIIYNLYHNTPLDEQPLGFMNVGSGDGRIQLEILKFILNHTNRGKNLSKYPLVGVVSDLNAAAIKRQRSTLQGLENIPGLHIIYIPEADVTEPEEINEKLKTELLKIGFDSRDISVFERTEEFITHERFLKVKDPGEAKLIISEAVKNLIRKDGGRKKLNNALILFGHSLSEIPVSEDDLIQFTIDQFESSFVDDDPRGRFVPGFVEAADEIAYLHRWIKVLTKDGTKKGHGMRTLELHIPRPSQHEQEVPLSIHEPMIAEESLSGAYLGTHWPGQYPTSYEEKNLITTLVGLTAKKTVLSRARPESPVPVSLHHYDLPSTAASSPIISYKEKIQHTFTARDKTEKTVPITLELFGEGVYYPGDISNIMRIEHDTWRDYFGVELDRIEILNRISHGFVIVARNEEGKIVGQIFMANMNEDDIPDSLYDISSQERMDGEVLVDYAATVDPAEDIGGQQLVNRLIQSTLKFADRKGIKKVVAYSRARPFDNIILNNPNFQKGEYAGLRGSQIAQIVWEAFKREYLTEQQIAQQDYAGLTWAHFQEFFSFQISEGYAEWFMSSNKNFEHLSPSELQRYFGLSFGSMEEFIKFHVQHRLDGYLQGSHLALGAGYIGVIPGSRPDDLRAGLATVRLDYDVKKTLARLASSPVHMEDQWWDRTNADPKVVRNEDPDFVEIISAAVRALPPNAHILFLGEGPTFVNLGPTLEAHPGINAVATDFSSEAVRQLEVKKAKKGYGNLTILQMDHRDQFPFENGSMDVVVSDLSAGIFSTNKEFRKTLKEINRVLRKWPTSRFILRVREASSKDARYDQFKRAAQEDARVDEQLIQEETFQFTTRSGQVLVRNFWTSESLRGELEQAGFEIVEMTGPYQKVLFPTDGQYSLITTVLGLSPASITATSSPIEVLEQRTEQLKEALKKVIGVNGMAEYERLFNDIILGKVTTILNKASKARMDEPLISKARDILKEITDIYFINELDTDKPTVLLMHGGQ